MGNGGLVSSGTRSGDLVLLAGEDLRLTGAHIGHVTTDSTEAITGGDTLIGVSQNNPYAGGSGEIIASHMPPHMTSFRSAHEYGASCASTCRGRTTS